MKNFIDNLITILFLEYVDKGSNGVYGPGYRNYSYWKVSYGKLALWAVVIGVILILTLK